MAVKYEWKKNFFTIVKIKAKQGYIRGTTR